MAVILEKASKSLGKERNVAEEYGFPGKSEGLTVTILCIKGGKPSKIAVESDDRRDRRGYLES